jgi:hypothetical protein
MTNSKSQINSNFQAQMTETILSEILTGDYPAIPALQGGVKGYNMKETPCRKAPPFRAKSFNFGHSCLPAGRGILVII